VLLVVFWSDGFFGLVFTQKNGLTSFFYIQNSCKAFDVL
jgi:hypothetical protein